MKIKCIIADDEQLARNGIEKFIHDLPFLELVACCTDAQQATGVMATTDIDLLLLDIKMPGMTGISLLKNMPLHPATIITTAYPEYAVEGYELDIIDYLLKPFSFERFAKAVHKAREYIELKSGRQNNMLTNGYCFVKCNKIIEKIFYRDIVYVESLQNYVVIHTTERKYVSYLTLKCIEDYLPSTVFIKINKSQVINRERISKLEGNKISIDKVGFVIGRAFKDHVIETVFNSRLIKR